MSKWTLTLLCCVLLLSTSHFERSNTIKEEETTVKNLSPLKSQTKLLQAEPVLAAMEGNMEWSWNYGGVQPEEAVSIIQTIDGGFVVIGYTESYGEGSNDGWLIKMDKSGVAQWNRTYGGSNSEVFSAVRQTHDGGFILIGSTNSSDTESSDGWVVKTKPNGEVEWTQTYGGASWDQITDAIQTHDGGFILAGSTRSFGAGDLDFWLVKISLTGNIEWTQTYGGPKADEAHAIIQTLDPGFVMVGSTFSYGMGNSDAWMVKTDAMGNILWNQTYGNVAGEAAVAITQTSEGGYALAGWSGSSGMGDFWLVKTDIHGNEDWQRIYGGLKPDGALSIIQTSENGYLLAGWTSSYGRGPINGWVVKTDAYGITQWTRTYSRIDEASVIHSVLQTVDERFVFIGYTESFKHNNKDIWAVKIDLRGAIEWTKTHLAGKASAITQTSDGGFAFFVAGQLVKTNANWTVEWSHDYDGSFYAVIPTADGGFSLTGFHQLAGPTSDAFNLLVKTDVNGIVQWNISYGNINAVYAGEWEIRTNALIQTTDEGYALAGHIESAGSYDRDFWMIKINANGAMQWNQTYVEQSTDEVVDAILQTPDNGYILAGNRGQLIKTDSNGNEEWRRNYQAEFHSIIPTRDSGFVLGCTRRPFLLKINSQGEEEWRQSFGSSPYDITHSIIALADGGFAIIGDTQSHGYGARPWVVKTNTQGEVEWMGTYGYDQPMMKYSINSAIQTGDGGIILAGYQNSLITDNLTIWLVKIAPEDTIPPTLTGRTSMAFEEGMSGQVINWSVNDNYPDTYELYANFVLVDSGSWTNGTIEWDVAGLPPATYNFTIVIRDLGGNSISDTIKVVISSVIPPDISSPADTTFEKGTTGQEISWVVGDHHPATYEIYINSTQIESNSWTNGTLAWNADGLDPGTYNLTLVIWDMSNNQIADSVWITVTPSTLSEFVTMGILSIMALLPLELFNIWRKKK